MGSLESNIAKQRQQNFYKKGEEFEEQEKGFKKS